MTGDDLKTGGSAIIYYSVYKVGATDPVITTSGTSYLYTNDGAETEVAFYIVANNIYGAGD
jgi:hypothetical protein